MTEPARAGCKVRYYDEEHDDGEWFYPGVVICVDEFGYATVEFDRWILRYPPDTLCGTWMDYQHLYVTTRRGEVVKSKEAHC